MSVSSLSLGGGPIMPATSHFYRTSGAAAAAAPHHASQQEERERDASTAATRQNHQSRQLLLPLLPHPDSRGLVANQRLLHLDPADPNGAKRKRASKPKVRSGCITCKIRRVKCDERKPLCARCEKADVECDGYVKDAKDSAVGAVSRAEQSEMIAAAQRAKRRILPRPGTVGANGERRMVSTARKDLLRANPGAVQIDGSDVSYYDLFRNQLIRDLSGSCHSEFWSRIVLNESTRDPCVRESILAIGALSQTLFFAAHSGTSQTVRRPLEDLSARVFDHHHRAALKHYINAVSVYRQRIQQAAGEASPRSVIIMTLLLIAFEFIQGNMKMVDTLMGTGMRLIENSITLVERPSESPESESRSLSPPEGRREEEMDDIEHLLPCLNLMSGFTHFFVSHRTSIRTMKSSPTYELPTPGVTPLPKLQTMWGKFYTRAVVHVMRTLHDQLAYNRLTAAAVMGEQRSFLARIAAWREVLQKYRADPAFADDERARRTLEIIDIHRVLVYILISCGLDRCDMTFDLFEDQFREVIDRCGAIIREGVPLSKICFTFGEGLTSPLATVICKCRNHDLRMRAAKLVNSISWRDGAWDGKLLVIGKLGTAMLEERRMDEKGFIPADSRWIWKEGKWDLERRELTATYCRLMPNADGSRTHAQLVLDMDSLPDICSQWGCTGRHDPFDRY